MTGDPDLYQMLVAAGCQTGHHESDLHVEMTPTAQAVVRQFREDYTRVTGSTLPLTVQIFRSAVDGKLWYDIPFMYSPWWEKRQAVARGEFDGYQRR